MEIVGVVEDIREGPLDQAIPPVLYLPFNAEYRQLFLPGGADFAG